MSYRKSFLVFVLAFVALNLGGSQEAMGQWEWFWEGPAPGSVDGGSTVLVYKCDRGGVGTNTVIPGDPDIFRSDGEVVCDFTGQVKGTGIKCEYHVEWQGDLVSCVDTNAGALVTVRSPCDNLNVVGELSCPTLQGPFGPVVDLLGISSKSECERLFGKPADTLFTQVTYAGVLCSQVPNSTSDGVLVLAGLTKTTTNLCHSDGDATVDCFTGGKSNKSNSEINNLGETACVASPQTWNIDCKGGSGTKDQGSGTVCYVNEQPGFFSFDPTKLDAATATLNGVPVDIKKGQPQCIIKDCNGDGVLDFQCSFPTCFGGTAPAAPDGELTMITNFLGDTGGGLTCTTTVATSGQGL